MARTILVPVDFSEASHPAVRRARALARSTGASLRLLHVSPPPGDEVDPRLAEQLTDELRRGAKLRLADLAADFDDGRVPLSTAFEEADPSRAIRDAAGADDVSLIVMGSHGRRGIDRLLLGSVAARTVQRAPKPVLVVRGEHSADDEAGPLMRSILLATDFSEKAAAVEPEIAEWALRLGAEVEVLHVIRETSVLLAPYAVTGSSDFEGEMFEAAESRMEGVLRRLRERGIHAKAKIVYGVPAEEILRRAEATNVDLVAVGTRGYSGFQRFLLGSVAQRVLSQAHCDVLVDAGGERPTESTSPELSGGSGSLEPSLHVSMAWTEAVDPVSGTTARVEAVTAFWGEEAARAEASPSPTMTEDTWVPLEAEDLANRLFALVMAGVLGVILAMWVAAAGI